MVKHSKHARNKLKCQAYRAEGRREKNKARKAATRERRLAKMRARKENVQQ